jgi:hypothetical protein
VFRLYLTLLNVTKNERIQTTDTDVAERSILSSLIPKPTLAHDLEPVPPITNGISHLHKIDLNAVFCLCLSSTRFPGHLGNENNSVCITYLSHVSSSSLPKSTVLTVLEDDLSSGLLRHVGSQKLADISGVHIASIVSSDDEENQQRDFRYLS